MVSPVSDLRGEAPAGRFGEEGQPRHVLFASAIGKNGSANWARDEGRWGCLSRLHGKSS